jgi:hypothetical protein
VPLDSTTIDLRSGIATACDRPPSGVQAVIGEHADPRLAAGRLNANDQTVALAGSVAAGKPERPLGWHIGQTGRTEIELPSERPVALNIPTNRLAADHDLEARSANCEFEGTGRVLQPVPVAERPQVERDVVPRIVMCT